MWWASWAVLESSWGLFGPSWGLRSRPGAILVRPSWGSLGCSLARLGRLEARTGEHAEILRKPNGTCLACGSWGHLERSVGALFFRLAALALLGRLGALLGNLEALLAVWGGSWGRREAF